MTHSARELILQRRRTAALAGVTQIPNSAHRMLQRGYDPKDEAACDAAIERAKREIKERTLEGMRDR